MVLGVGLVAVREVDGWPVTVRRAMRTGWTRRCSARPEAATAALTESTRKGMSSVTIWTTVCSERQPSASTVGLKTLTAAVPTGRLCPSSTCETTAP